MSEVDETKVGSDNNLKHWVFWHFKQSWPKLLLLLTLSLIGVGLQLLTPWPMKVLVDSVFGQIPAPGPLAHLGQYGLLLVVAGTYVTIYLVAGLVEILEAYFNNTFSFKMGLRLKTDLFYHILSLPASIRRKLQSGDYVYRLNEETGNLPALVFGTSTIIIESVVTIVVALIILMVINPQMAAIGLLVAPLLYISIKFFGPRIEAKSTDIEADSSNIYNYSSEAIEHAEVIQSFNREGYQTSFFGNLVKHRQRIGIRLGLLSGWFEFTNNLFTSFGIAAVVIIGGLKVGHGITLGELLIFITYMSYFYDPLQRILSSIGGYKSLIAGTRRMFAVLSQPALPPGIAPGTIAMNHAQGHIVFQDVSFKYGDNIILDKVSFEIKPGQKVAFVGPSGSGKSTILSLLPLFNRPASGHIYLDNYDIATLNAESLHEQLGIVTQEPALFSGTIRENISFAKPYQTFYDYDIINAAKAANASEFIDKLPKQYQTNVGEEGTGLSGGQKQRIAIARAFLKDAPVLILDEPSSAQDPDSGTKIVLAIRRLMEGKTVLLSTHEVTLLREMDVVYVVNNATVKDVSHYGGVENYIFSLLTHRPITEIGQ